MNILRHWNRCWGLVRSGWVGRQDGREGTGQASTLLQIKAGWHSRSSRPGPGGYGTNGGSLRGLPLSPLVQFLGSQFLGSQVLGSQVLGSQLIVQGILVDQGIVDQGILVDQGIVVQGIVDQGILVDQGIVDQGILVDHGIVGDDAVGYGSPAAGMVGWD